MIDGVGSFIFHINDSFEGKYNKQKYPIMFSATKLKFA
jgi:hypothetical protein